MTAKPLAHYQDLFRTQGLAFTVQRRTILREILDRKDHPTADHIYDAVRDDVPGLSRTTVYRVLDTLVNIGAVRKVFHHDAAVRFDPNMTRHHHLICQECGGVEDVDDETMAEISVPELADSGFAVSDYTINFSGVCSGCRQPTPLMK